MRICKIPNCNNKHFGKGYCEKHYLRFRIYGDPQYTKTEKHGMSLTTEYSSWYTMIARCANKNNNDYKNYGGRGITVCKQWKNSFMTFLGDMGPRPFSKAQIDRINNNDGYTPQNCYWATAAQNNQNKRNNKLTMEKAKEIRRKYKSENISQAKLALIFEVVQSTIYRVINQKAWKTINLGG